jgi:hypothetical protein
VTGVRIHQAKHFGHTGFAVRQDHPREKLTNQGVQGRLVRFGVRAAGFDDFFIE